jgi:exonuclease III
LTIPGVPCSFSTFNLRSLRNFMKSTFSSSFLKTGFDILGFSEVQAGFKDLHGIAALRTYMTQYRFSFWCCSTTGPQGQNCFGYAGVAVMCRRRPSHVFFGFNKTLEPPLDTDTQGRLITLIFLDYILFYLYTSSLNAPLLHRLSRLRRICTVFLCFLRVLGVIAPILHRACIFGANSAQIRRK